MNEYVKQAEDFLKSTETTLELKYMGNNPFPNDTRTELHRTYGFVLKNKRYNYTSNFYDSLMNTEIHNMSVTEWYRENIWKYNKKLPYPSESGFSAYRYKSKHDQAKKEAIPNAYDILACLTKYDPGFFEEFCGDYGYDEDSRRAYRIYEAVREEWMHISRLWNEEQLELLREIN